MMTFFCINLASIRATFRGSLSGHIEHGVNCVH
jgi:hypothetical protein